jgi:transcriptional regulator GlxA family with amidase domain
MSGIDFTRYLAGFGSEETMRSSFQHLLAVPPQDYRARFASRST